jgi:hypothetical protein
LVVSGAVVLRNSNLLAAEAVLGTKNSAQWLKYPNSV